MKLLQKLSALILSSEQRAEFLQQVGRWVGDTMRLKVASTCPRRRQTQESASPLLEADCVSNCLWSPGYPPTHINFSSKECSTPSLYPFIPILKLKNLTFLVKTNEMTKKPSSSCTQIREAGRGV